MLSGMCCLLFEVAQEECAVRQSSLTCPYLTKPCMHVDLRFVRGKHAVQQCAGDCSERKDFKKSNRDS